MTGAADRTLTLITGANKGIGLAIARGLGARGHHILLGCRDPQRGQEAAGMLAAEGVSCEVVAVDVTDPGSTASAIDRVGQRYGRLDVLINNAGIARDRQTADRDLRSVMRETLETNVTGAACLIDAAATLLAKSQHPRIVNMSSGLGSLALQSDPDFEFASVKLPAYCSSKAALNMLTVVYAARLAGQGIKVNSADPGYTATDLNAFRGYRTTEQAAAVAIQLAMLDDDGPTGGFFNDDGPMPW